MQARLEQHRQSRAAQESALLDREDLRSRIRVGLNIRVAGKRSLLDLLLTLGIQVHAAPVDDMRPHTDNQLRLPRQVADCWPMPSVQVEGIAPAKIAQAYKKALLHYHPDRHVSASLEQQLYAEEVFKIISQAADQKPC